MNFREGMRRVGILLGVAGGIVGGLIAFPQGRELAHDRSTHLRFESLMALPTIRTIAKDAIEYQTGLPYIIDSVSPQPGRVTPGFLDYSTLADLAKTIAAKRQLKPPPGSVLVQQPKAKPENIVVRVNLDEIKEVYVDSAGMITEIDLTTGELVPRIEPSPPLLAYFLLLLYPILGFLLPWACIRVLTWVGTGFVAPPR